jgi:uncharacterized protein YcbX
MAIVGSSAELWRFPVKSMKGEQLQEMTVTEQGLLGDRVCAIIDGEPDRVVGAKSVKLFRICWRVERLLSRHLERRERCPQCESISRMARQ